MTLTEFLSYFDFDYCIYDNGKTKKIGIIDYQGANLGDIDTERFSLDEKGVLAILDRLDIYYKDYIFDNLENVLNDEHDIDTSDMEWVDIYKKVQELGLTYDMDIMPYIFGDKKLELDFNEKQIEKEWFLEVDEFIANIDYNDVDLRNKLNHLLEKNKISSNLYKIISNNNNLGREISDIIMAKIQYNQHYAKKYLNQEMDNLKEAYDKDEFDYKTALYYWDDIYLVSISKSINMPKELLHEGILDMNVYYKCKTCDESVPANDLLNHLKNKHDDLFHESLGLGRNEMIEKYYRRENLIGKYFMNEDEHRILNNLLSLSAMDDLLLLNQNFEWGDFFYDFEQDEVMSFQTGLRTIYESGVLDICLENNEISQKDFDIMNKLFYKLDCDASSYMENEIEMDF